jgi:hypothetical protein
LHLPFPSPSLPLSLLPAKRSSKKKKRITHGPVMKGAREETSEQSGFFIYIYPHPLTSLSLSIYVVFFLYTKVKQRVVQAKVRRWRRGKTSREKKYIG